jgi:hypothetical protein
VALKTGEAPSVSDCLNRVVRRHTGAGSAGTLPDEVAALPSKIEQRQDLAAEQYKTAVTLDPQNKIRGEGT